MKLKQMLVGLEGLKVKGDLDIDIKGIEKNSKEVKEGYLFVAIKGFTVDGHEFVNDAVKLGATAVMIEEGCDLKSIKVPTLILLNGLAKHSYTSSGILLAVSCSYL